MKSCPMRWDSVSEAKVRSTQLSAVVGDGVAGIGVGVAVGVALGVGLGVGVGEAVGLAVTDGDAVGVGDTSAVAKRHPDSSAATIGSTTIGLISRSRCREVTNPLTLELLETCTADPTAAIGRPCPAN
jgi:hypothetical protein